MCKSKPVSEQVEDVKIAYKEGKPKASESIVGKLNSKNATQRNVGLLALKELLEEGTSESVQALGKIDGLLQAVVNMMIQGETPAEQENASCTLAKLAHGCPETGKVVCGIQGSLQALVNLLQNGSKAATKSYALLALRDLAEVGDKSSKTIAGIDGCLQSLRFILKHGVAREQKSAALCIASLAKGCLDNQKAISGFDGLLQVLVDLMTDDGRKSANADEVSSKQSYNAKPHSSVLALLTLAKGCPEACMKIGGIDGVFSALVDLLKTGSMHEQIMAANVLGTLSENQQEHKVTIGSMEGSLLALVELLKQRDDFATQIPDCPEASVTIISALMLLAKDCPENQAAIAGIEGSLSEVVIISRIGEFTEQISALVLLEVLAQDSPVNKAAIRKLDTDAIRKSLVIAPLSAQTDAEVGTEANGEITI